MKLYCVCRKPDNGEFMIQCDKCNEWFHGDCVNEKEPGPEEYTCRSCLEKPITPVRPKPVKQIKKESSKTATMRTMAEKGFIDTFTAMFDKLKDQGDLDPDIIWDPKAYGIKCEQALFGAFSINDECTAQYKVKYRSLQYNLKDSSNIGLRQRLFGKGSRLTFEELVVLPPEAMNEASLAKAEKAMQDSLKNVFKPVDEAATAISNTSADVAPNLVKQNSIDAILTNVAPVNLDELLAKMEPASADHNSVRSPATIDEILAKMETPVVPSIPTIPIIPANQVAPESDAADQNLKRTRIETPQSPKKKLKWCSLPNGKEQIWEGKISMPQVASFKGTATQILGPHLLKQQWSDLLTPNMQATGRIRQNDVNDYISARAYQNKLIFVVEFQSSDAGFETLCQYLVDKDRYAVMGHTAKIKDFYLVPVLSKKGVGFKGLDIKESNENKLYGILVMNLTLEELIIPPTGLNADPRMISALLSSFLN